MKVSFYSEYYLSILITVDLKLDFDIAYGVGVGGNEDAKSMDNWRIFKKIIIFKIGRFNFNTFSFQLCL